MTQPSLESTDMVEVVDPIDALEVEVEVVIDLDHIEVLHFVSGHL